MKKTILITGASTGIGRETAIYFAGRGWNVAATMRTLDKGGDLVKYSNLRLFRLDVDDQHSIGQAIDNTIRAFGAIDVLFNNAGYALAGVFEAMTTEQIKRQFDTNVFGVMNVTLAILPYFRSRCNGTIITTTSMGGLITFPLYSTYHSTKWAVEGFMESLHYELRAFNIRVKNIEPGAIRTEFNNATEFVTHADYQRYVGPAQKNMMDSYRNAPGPDIVAKKVFRAACDRSFRLRYPVSMQSSFLLGLKRSLPNSWFFGMIRSIVERGVPKVGRPANQGHHD